MRLSYPVTVAVGAAVGLTLGLVIPTPAPEPTTRDTLATIGGETVRVTSETLSDGALRIELTPATGERPPATPDCLGDYATACRESGVTIVPVGQGAYVRATTATSWCLAWSLDSECY